MKKIILILVILLAGMEGISWLTYKNSKKISSSTAETVKTQSVISTDQVIPEIEQTKEYDASSVSGPSSDGDLASFPPPIVEIIDGVSQRTIHMGVRQWEWDPSQISVNYGEKVILIMHNADVPHSIMIPGLKVNVAIPEEGAIVTFMAEKRGTFDFFCAVPCGSGHSKMQGKITVA